MSGKGVFAVEAPVPVDEIDTVELDGGSELIVDGDFMLMYSASLNVSIGPLVKVLRNALRSGEGFVYKLNGRGTAWIMPTAKVSRSEEHTSELQSLMRISYAVFCLKKNRQHRSYTDSTTLAYNTKQKI